MPRILSSFNRPLIAWVVFASISSLALLYFRLHTTGSPMFGFLAWNLFLAFVPILFSSLAWYFMRTNAIRSALVMLIPWLLFFPNAPYILTDLMHLKVRHPVPLWYDLFLLLSFALNGLFLAFISLSQVEFVLRNVFQKRLAVLVMFGCVLLSAYGIYLGRFKRLNSWDVLAQPRTVAYEVLKPLIYPFDHPRTLAMTVIMGLMIWTGHRITRRAWNMDQLGSQE